MVYILEDAAAKSKQENKFSEGIIEQTPTFSNLPKYVKGELIVKLKNDISNKISANVVKTDISTLDSLNSKYGVKNIENVFPAKHESFFESLANNVKQTFNIEVPSRELNKVYKIKINQNTDVEKVVKEYSAVSEVEYAEPNYIYYTNFVPNDKLYSQQWSHQITSAEIAWDTEKGSSSTIIAIIDTGVDYNHEDLKTNIWHNPKEIPNNGIDDDNNGYVDDTIGYDFVDYQELVDYCNANPNICRISPREDYLKLDNDPMDVVGHGTHCSGIAAGVGNNNLGIIGICPSCSIMPVRAGMLIEINSNGQYYQSGGLSDDAIVNGIKYATDNGARVISMSFGGREYSQLQKDMIDYAYSKGVVLIAAAGNENTAEKPYPAGYDNVLSVGATDELDNKASYSNYGDWVDVAAPGSNILSTVPTKISYSSELKLGYSLFDSYPFEYSAIVEDESVHGMLANAGNGTIEELNNVNLTGKIVLIKRGDISFHDKVENVYNKGAIGVIIYNNAPGSFIGTLVNQSKIPAVSVSEVVGNSLLYYVNSSLINISIKVNKITENYELESGTSMATPYVAGIAGLLLSKEPSLKNSEVYAKIITGIDLIPDKTIGQGRVNVTKALQENPNSIITLENVNINANTEYNEINPGAAVDIYFTLKNIGANAGDVQGSIIIDNSYATVSEGNIDFGTMDTLAIRKNTAPFIIKINNNTPKGTKINVKLKLTSANSNYSPEFDVPIYTSKTIVVGKDNQSDYKNIGDAVKNANSGDIIFIKNGIYNETITIDKNNLKIIGESRDNTILSTNNSFGVALYIAAAKNVIIESITFEPNSQLNIYRGFSQEGILISGQSSILPSSNIKIRNSSFKNLDYAIDLNGPGYIENVTISNSTFIDNYEPLIRSISMGNKIIDVSFENNYVIINNLSKWIPDDSGGNAYAFFNDGLSSIDNFRIMGNHIIDNVSREPKNAVSFLHVFMLNFDVDTKDLNKNISNNIFEKTYPGNSSTAFILGGKNNYYMSNNKFVGNYQHLIYSLGSNVIIDGTKLQDNIGSEGDYTYSCYYFGPGSLLVSHSEIINGTLEIDSCSVNDKINYSVNSNRYSEYTGEDINGDGIGDTPQKIYDQNGNFITQDNTPLILFSGIKLTRPKSQIINNGTINITGYLFMDVEQFLGNSWQGYQMVYEDTLPRTIPANNVQALDTIWNNYNISINDPGKYRVHAEFRDAYGGEPIQTTTGLLNNYWEFNVSGTIPIIPSGELNLFTSKNNYLQQESIILTSNSKIENTGLIPITGYLSANIEQFNIYYQINEETDKKKIGNEYNFLELGEAINATGQTIFSSNDLNALSNETFQNSLGTFTYTQKLELPSAKVVFEEDTDQSNDPSLYLKFDANKPAYTYTLQFTPPIESGIINQTLKDLQGHNLQLFDKTFQIISAKNESNKLSLNLLQTELVDILQEGSTKTYTHNGKDYQVTASYISSSEARFTINGETTDKLSEGETYTLVDGTRIGVFDIITNFIVYEKQG